MKKKHSIINKNHKWLWKSGSLEKEDMKTFKVFEMKLRWCSAESRNKISVIQISEFYDQTTLMYISPAIGAWQDNDFIYNTV